MSAHAVAFQAAPWADPHNHAKQGPHTSGARQYCGLPGSCSTSSRRVTTLGASRPRPTSSSTAAMHRTWANSQPIRAEAGATHWCVYRWHKQQIELLKRIHCKSKSKFTMAEWSFMCSQTWDQGVVSLVRTGHRLTWCHRKAVPRRCSASAERRPPSEPLQGSSSTSASRIFRR